MTDRPEYEPEHIRRQTYCARMIRCECLDIDGAVGRDHCWTCGRIIVTRPSRTAGDTIKEHAGPSVAERLARLETQREATSGNARRS